jgi:hypothetical protein
MLSNSSSGTSNGLPTLKRRARFSSGRRFKDVVQRVVGAITVFVRERERVVKGARFSLEVRFEGVVRVGLGLVGASIPKFKKTRSKLVKKKW